VYSLTDADFDTYIVNPSATNTNGLQFYAAVAGGLTALSSTGVDYFSSPHCEVDANSSTLWVCQQYQVAVDSEADGTPRFNSPQSYTAYSFVGFVNMSDSNSLFSLLGPVMYAEWTYMWTGASTLPALAATIAVSAAVMAF
jgi:hypothetical protein